MKRTYAALCFLIASFSANASTNLCLATEEVVFSCKVKQKVVSVCSAKEGHNAARQIYYRYGRDQSNIELIYPQTQEASDFLVYSSGSARASTAVIGFTKGRYTYSVFHTISSFGFNGSGVIIRKDQTILQTTLCEKNTVDAEYLLRKVDSLGRPSEDLDYVGPEQ